MKPLIDLSQTAGKTVEKAVLSEDDDCLAVHFTDGTVLLLGSCTSGGEPIITVDDYITNPTKYMLEAGICTEEEHQEFVASQESERRIRMNELASKYPAIFRRE